MTIINQHFLEDCTEEFIQQRNKQLDITAEDHFLEFAAEYGCEYDIDFDNSDNYAHHRHAFFELLIKYAEIYDISDAEVVSLQADLDEQAGTGISAQAIHTQGYYSQRSTQALSPIPEQCSHSNSPH